MPLTEDAYGDAKNALYLADACDFAYLPQDQGGPKYQELGLTAKLISVDNTQAYVGYDDNNLVVAFRGSEAPITVDGLKDWFLTNADNLLIQPTGRLAEEFVAAGVGARWHQGFVNAITEIWDPLYAEVSALQQERERCFWITGHSLGGALAMLASWLFFRKTMKPHQTYTFGAPMVGNKVVAEAFEREFGKKISRFANGPDPVPLLPMMSLAANDFVHPGQPLPAGAVDATANLISYLAEAAGSMVQGVLSLDIKERVWGAVMARVNAHLMPDYRKLIG
ncbi:MAG: lipase family protein [Fimbriiglobus sp.]|nr:lipase family protein [Fimbriiglobus sp.]